MITPSRRFAPFLLAVPCLVASPEAPARSLHHARIIPTQIPNGKKRKPSHSRRISRDGWKPSPIMKATTNPMLATLQSLAVQRNAGDATRGCQWIIRTGGRF